MSETVTTTITIKNRHTQEVIFSGEYGSMKEAVLAAVKGKADLRGANLFNAKVNWESHQLISEILLRAADTSVSRRMIAGLIRISTDWCWRDLVRIDHPEKQWALDELKKWLQPGETHPYLRPTLETSQEKKEI